MMKKRRRSERRHDQHRRHDMTDAGAVVFIIMLPSPIIAMIAILEPLPVGVMVMLVLPIIAIVTSTRNRQPMG